MAKTVFVPSQEAQKATDSSASTDAATAQSFRPRFS